MKERVEGKQLDPRACSPSGQGILLARGPRRLPERFHVPRVSVGSPHTLI